MPASSVDRVPDAGELLLRVSACAVCRTDLQLCEGDLPARALPPAFVAAATAVVALGLIGLTIATSADRHFALWFCAAAVGTLILFRLGASLVMLTTRAAQSLGSAGTRLGLASLHRPGAATSLMLVSVGLGLATLAAVALIQGNVQREILDQLPADAPTMGTNSPRWVARCIAAPAAEVTTKKARNRAVPNRRATALPKARNHTALTPRWTTSPWRVRRARARPAVDSTSDRPR